MMKYIIESLKTNCTLKELPVGEFQKMKAKGMTFTIQQYEAVGLGNVSVMQAAGFFGLMKMDTLIINPVEKDLPLFSYDRIFAMGNDTLIIELYDTLLGQCDLAGINQVKAAYSNLPERDPGEHWYDNIKLAESVSMKGKKAQTAAFDELTRKYFEEYLACAGEAGVCDPEAKREKASVYVEGLLQNGGPSTDVFKKEFGEEKTGELFRRILFGTE